jgi:adenine-specific DNA-methyltransferase
MTGKQRLELTWIGKEHRPRLEPRILLEDPKRSHHSVHRVTDDDVFDNRLIFGDNLLALKALEAEFAGKVKCVFIDPPYNTGSAFEHYDDGLEHSIWLSMMRDRLEVIRRLLAEDGSLWITIDDNEAHYLKVMCDEVFGRGNFVASVIWQKLFTIKNSARYLSDMHEYVLVYSKAIDNWKRNLLPRSSELDETYTNPDNDPRGPWTTNAIQARNFYSLGSYTIRSPNGREFVPPAGTYWRVSEETFGELEEDARIWWGRDGTATPRVKKFLAEAKQGVVPATLWFHDDVGTNAEAKLEVRELFADIAGADVFMIPKPERLMKRVLEIATNPGDLVLDSFAGSGTTGAVAYKMGRRWIMVELGEHCHTHVIPRLTKVIDDQDPGGITKAVGWRGGGGYRYFRLAPSLIEMDSWGRPVINPSYNAAMLAEAVCKLEGFTYAPSETLYWQHGHSTERDFIYVTTSRLNHAKLHQLSDEVGPDRSLLIACSAFQASKAGYPNLTIKKIPTAVLHRAEWGRDDYSLQVASLPEAPAAEGQQELVLEGV